MRTVAILLTLVVVASALPQPANAAEPARLRLGMDIGSMDALRAAGAPPELAMFWLGAWNGDDPYGAASNWFKSARSAGVTPVVQWWYWGDSISPSCVENGCDGRSQGQWTTAGQRIAQAARDTMGGAEVLVVVEPEFNKDGIETWETWDGLWVQHADIFHAVPGVKVVLSFGNWGHEHWGNFDRAVAEADLLGFQTMRGSTRDSLSSYQGADSVILAAAKRIQDQFGRDSILTDLALSSYPEPEWLEHQRAELAQIFSRADEYHAAGLRAIVYRGLKDSPSMSLDNYFGEAERHWGLAWSDGRAKPALKEWVAYANPAGFSAPGGIEAEALPATTGGRATDAAASGGAAWNLWSNGDLTAVVDSPGGTFDLVVRASGEPAAGVDARMEVRVDGALVAVFDVPAGWAEHKARVSLAAGDRTVVVRFTNDGRDASGDRNLLVDRIDARTPPAGAPRLAVPVSAPAEVVAGESFRATYTVENVGGRTFSASYGFTVDGLWRKVADVALDPGERRQVALDLSLPAGTHTLEARMHDGSTTVPGDGATAQVRALAPGAAVLASPLAAPSSVEVGKAFTASYRVTNPGETTLTETFGVRAQGALVGARSVTLAPGASADVAATVTLTTAGSHTIEARMGATGATLVPGEGATAVVRALAPGEARLASPLAAPSSVEVGKAFTASYRVTNAGETTLTQTFGVRAQGAFVGARSVTLAPGASADVAATVTLTTAGSHTLEARMGATGATLVPGTGASVVVQATQPAPFAATFQPKPGNEWWLEVGVSANRPLAGVSVSINGGAAQPLTLRDWGTWAGSYHAPTGSKVVFSATATDGSRATSGAYRWPDATPWVALAWTKEAESAAVRTVGGAVTDAKASGGAAWNLWTKGAVADSFSLPAAGTVQVSVVAKGTPLGGKQATFDLLVDGKVVGSYTATSAYATYAKSLTLGAGKHEVRVVFKNDQKNMLEDRNLIVDVLKATGG